MVGGGPAGTSTAVALARAGVGVMVVDRARFPRPKPCAEYLSPEASRILDAMGALDAVEATGAAQLAGVLVRAPNGAEIRGEFLSAHGYSPFRERGLSVRREVLDTVLVDCARGAGVEVREGARVTRCCGERRSGASSRAATIDGRDETIDARLVIGADGLHSVVARRLGLTGARALAAAPRARDALRGRHQDRRAGRDARRARRATSASPTSGMALTTVALVVPARWRREVSAGEGSGSSTRWLAAPPASRAAVRRRATRVSARSGDRTVRVAGAPGVGARRAARRRRRRLLRSVHRRRHLRRAAGRRARRRGGGRARSRSRSEPRRTARARRVRRCAAPRVRRQVARRAGHRRRRRLPVAHQPRRRHALRRRDLADLLIGVTGDFVPPREIVNARYLLADVRADPAAGPSGSARRPARGSLRR